MHGHLGPEMGGLQTRVYELPHTLGRALKQWPGTPSINEMGVLFQIRDVFCTQHLERRVLGCKTHLKSRYLALF